MAQMVAKAMAKTNVSGNDKALLDKLSAEFADELNNLGVRVAKLERNADKVKFTGEARYRYWSYRDEQADGSQKKTNVNSLQYRLFPTAEINDNWHVNARLTGKLDMAKDTTTSDMALTYIYADGKYKNFEVKLGRQSLYSTADEGLVTDDFFTGAQVTFGNKLKVALEAGRWDINKYGNETVTEGAVNDPANYQGIDLGYTLGKMTMGAAYRHFNSDVFKTAVGYDGKTDDANIWSVGGRYTFSKNVALAADYASNTKADDYNKSGSVEVDYKAANKANKGSWGAFVAYRYLGSNVSLMPTYDTARAANNEKGWDFGASYIPFTNVLTTLGYFNGKDLATNQKADTLYARVSFYF
jgi:hypothetical protein